MKRVVREGLEPDFVEQVSSYKVKPGVIASSNIKQFIDRNWDLIQSDPNIYYEYTNHKDGDQLTIYLTGNQSQVFDLAKEENKAVLEPALTPEETDLVGATPAIILVGNSSVNESWRSRRKIREGWGMEQRASADPRKQLDAILNSRDVKYFLDSCACRVRQIRNGTFKGSYEVQIEDRHASKALLASVIVQPTAFETYFSVSFYPQDNPWLPKKMEGDCRIDPERPGYAVRAFQNVLKNVQKYARG